MMGSDLKRSRLKRLPHDENLLRNCSKYWLGSCFLISICLFIYLPFMQIGHRKPIAFVWPSNQSRDVKNHILPSINTTLLSPNVLSGGGPPVYLLVVVMSAIRNFAERSAIRNSWAKEAANLKHVKVIFLTGKTSQPNATFKNPESRKAMNWKENLQKESSQYGDILQENFIDSYANLTIKSLMMLKWFTSSCDNIPYLLKADDDMYINLDNLFTFIKANQKPNILVGSLICGAVPIKDPYNKWYVPSYMYAESRFPNYLSGTAYLMSKSTANVIYEASLSTPIFHLEDIYITGILSDKAGIRPSDHLGFSFARRKPSNTCIYKLTISSHHVSPVEMNSIYERVSKPNLRCPKLKPKHLRNYGPGRCTWKNKKIN